MVSELIFDHRPRFNPDPIVRKEICHFIEPFDPGMVTLWVTISVIDPAVFVSSSTFTDNTFVMDGRDLYLMGNDPNELAAWVGVKAGQYFASLMNEPVPSNVALGEN